MLMNHFWNLRHMFCMFKGVEKFLNWQFGWSRWSPGVVLIQHPLHLHPKVALAAFGTLCGGAAQADGQGFVRCYVSLCFIMSPKSKRFGTRQWCWRKQRWGLWTPSIASQATASSQDQVPSADAKGTFFGIYLSVSTCYRYWVKLRRLKALIG